VIPRTDPELRPAPAPAVQVLTRARTDQYGNRNGCRGPVEIRNGLPEPRYQYRGTGGDRALDRAWKQDQKRKKAPAALGQAAAGATGTALGG
jgi:hypothetical protein